MTTPSIVVNQQVKPFLVQDLGVALTTLIIFQNSRKCNVLVANLDRDGFRALIEAIVADYRVAKTIGPEKADQKKKEWLEFDRIGAAHFIGA